VSCWASLRCFLHGRMLSGRTSWIVCGIWAIEFFRSCRRRQKSPSRCSQGLRPMSKRSRPQQESCRQAFTPTARTREPPHLDHSPWHPGDCRGPLVGTVVGWRFGWQRATLQIRNGTAMHRSNAQSNVGRPDEILPSVDTPCRSAVSGVSENTGDGGSDPGKFGR
jgi:hypothetical protein